MMALFKNRSNRYAIRIATVSFCLGTLLMLIFLMTHHDFIVTTAIIFIACYVPITIVLILVLFVNALINFKEIHEHVMTLIIVLMNIPIALLYINFINP